jgi:hypothetical protein
MQTEIIVAVIAFLGTLAGSFGGIAATSKLTSYRLQKLEEKVNKHNQVIERTYILEEQMKVANHRIKDLEDHENRGE